MQDSSQNTFLTGPLSSLYVKTALPIIFVMSMTGLLAIADAFFLGRYVGPEALAAVTLMFPLYMLMVALSTLVATGMSSMLARALGADRISDALGIFAGAHGLALALGAGLILLFFTFGSQAAHLMADGSDALADMGLTYLRIAVIFSPLMFVLGVNSDALRNEGRVGLMAALSLLVSLANIAFNYVLIAQLNMGIGGSAYGTVLAQSLALAIIMVFRVRGQTQLRPTAFLTHSLFGRWGRILALGAPQSLNFLGIAMGSAVIIAALQLNHSPNYEDTVSAYGIITRILTFVFMPMLGLSQAMQTITGNNFGAQLWDRSDKSLTVGISLTFGYCVIVQIVLFLSAPWLGGAFVDDPHVIAEVGRILPMITAMMFIAGPLAMISGYFQAIGDARRALMLGLSKQYLFAVPLTLILPLAMGEFGIWAAPPLAELLQLTLVAFVLAITAKTKGLGWGVFHAGSAK